MDEVGKFDRTVVYVLGIHTANGKYYLMNFKGDLSKCKSDVMLFFEEYDAEYYANQMEETMDKRFGYGPPVFVEKSFFINQSSVI